MQLQFSAFDRRFLWLSHQYTVSVQRKARETPCFVYLATSAFNAALLKCGSVSQQCAMHCHEAVPEGNICI